MQIRLKQSLKKGRFYPSLLKLFINLFCFAKKGLFEGIQDLSLSVITGKILDVGCRNKPYEKFSNLSEYIGLKIDLKNNRRNKKTDFFYEGNIFSR